MEARGKGEYIEGVPVGFKVVWVLNSRRQKPL